MDVSQKLKELERRSRSLGVPVTVQRRAALKALVERSDHPTAEALYADVVRELPGVSKATVYRALDNLVQLGLARRVQHHGSVARFDGNGDPHHHLVCVRCDRITDIVWEGVDVGSFSGASADGFEVLDVSVSIRGICRVCATQTKRNDRSSQ